MKYTGKITHKILPENLKGILIRELLSFPYLRKDIVLLRRYFTGDCNTFENMSFNIAKKIGILYLSFLSFRLNTENRLEVEKQSHSPPQKINSSAKTYFHLHINLLNPFKNVSSESLKTYVSMKSQTEIIAVDIKDYLPELKQKFINAVGATNQMEQILINAAFENYELYLAFRENKATISDESNKKIQQLSESDHLQLASIALYYDKMTKYIKQGDFMEADTHLLKDLFQFYRESMLHFKFQKLAFKAIKITLSNIIQS